MYQQLWGYKVEEKLYLGVREQKKVEYRWLRAPHRKKSNGVSTAVLFAEPRDASKDRGHSILSER
jgi:hypothetical protein